MITACLFIKLNFAERVNFPRDGGRQGVPARDISLNRVVKQCSMIGLKGGEKDNVTLINQRK